MSNYEPNSPWVDRILSEYWASLEKQIGAEFMPTQADGSNGKHRKLVEYGCGHYGCVMPTSKPGIVIKLTTDSLEAHFIASAIKIGTWPDGIVRYERIYRLPAEYRRRPVFVLWREEAQNIGSLNSVRFSKTDDYDRRNIAQMEKRLFQFKVFAGMFKESFDRAYDKGAVYSSLQNLQQWAWGRIGLDDVDNVGGLYGMRGAPLPKWMRGANRMAAALRACEIVAEMMANEPKAYIIGQALEFYLEHKLLLADVHTNNVGQVTREEYGGPVWVITDPGHAVPLDARHDTVSVDILPQ